MHRATQLYRETHLPPLVPPTPGETCLSKDTTTSCPCQFFSCVRRRQRKRYFGLAIRKPLLSSCITFVNTQPERLQALAWEEGEGFTEGVTPRGKDQVVRMTMVIIGAPARPCAGCFAGISRHLLNPVKFSLRRGNWGLGTLPPK